MRLLQFSKYFDIDEKILEEEGYVNISLLCDMPLFVDPFLIFSSEKKEYKALHEKINKYLIFLKNKVKGCEYSRGIYSSLFKFSEVPNNWLGYCEFGNKGKGLGPYFGESLFKNLNNIFENFEHSNITKGIHIEKLTLLDEKVGADNISDFVVNIIKDYFLEITEEFAKKYINPNKCKYFNVSKAEFNYNYQRWMPKKYFLPCFNKDYVLLTPIDILTMDDSWINNQELLRIMPLVIEKVPNEQLRYEINNYLGALYKKDMKKEEEDEAKRKTLEKYPQLLDYFISIKEDEADEAETNSIKKVLYYDEFINNIADTITNYLLQNTNFYKLKNNSLEEAYERVNYLKSCIENNDGYKLFYGANSERLRTEKDLQLLFRFVCFDPQADINSEVNNGRGPVDYKFSNSSSDKTLIEFKLAKNTQLKQNLEKQVEIYEKANNTQQSIKVIFFFSEKEYNRVIKILNQLQLTNAKNIILIDCRNDNKISASKQK